MTTSHRLTRRKMVIGAGAFLGGLALSGGVSALLLNGEHSARLSMLGSGSGMSVLIASGRSRLLFLNGSDPADFGNALRRAQPPLLKRVDIVVVADDSAGSTFVRASLEQLDYERLFVIGDDRPLLDAGIMVRKTITEDMRFELPGGLSIDLLVAREVGTGTVSWIAHVIQGTRHALVAWGDQGDALKPQGSIIGAWLQLDGAIPEYERLRSLRPVSINVPAASMTGSEFTADFPDDLHWQPIRRRIHAGEATLLRMNDLPES